MPAIFSFVVIIRGRSQQSQFTFSENAKEPCGCSHQLVQSTKCQLSLQFSIGLQAQDCMDTVEKFTLTSTILSHLVLFCNNCIYKKKTRFAPLPYPMGKMCEIVILKLITRENWESVRSLCNNWSQEKRETVMADSKSTSTI